MKFELTEKEMLAVRAWKAEQDAKAFEIQKKDPKYLSNRLFLLSMEDETPIDNLLTYSFTPNGIGVTVTVKHGFTEDILDLTDISSW